MDNLAETTTPTDKIYKDRAIWFGSFVGGPLVAGYFIAENFKVLNEPENVKSTWNYTIPLTILVFSLALVIPQSSNFPSIIIPLAYTLFAYYISKHYQGPGIEVHLAAGGEEFDWWRIIGISLLGLIATFIILVIFVIIIQSLGLLPDELLLKE
tara:strand:+ start:43369 stop:43830 length:462 start_codon:yes stop_codon:yes gene_type:complete